MRLVLGDEQHLIDIDVSAGERNRRSRLSSSSTAGSSSSATVGLSAVPAGAQTDYTHYNLYAKLYPNAYQNYKPPTGKVQYCESTFYLGNTYQQGEVTAYKQMVSSAGSGRARPVQLHRRELQQQHCYAAVAAPERDQQRL